MSHQRVWRLLAAGGLALFGCACMLFSGNQGNQPEAGESAETIEAVPGDFDLETPGVDEDEMEGFAETLQAELEAELLDETLVPGEDVEGEDDEQATGPGVEFRNPGGLYTLTIPSDWSQGGREDRPEFCAPVQGVVCLSVQLRIKQGYADTLLADELSGLSEAVADYQELAAATAVEIGGLAGQRVDVSYTFKDQPTRDNLTALVFNRTGIILSASAPLDEYETYSGIFEQITNSFEWIDYADSPPYPQWLTREGRHIQFYYPPESWIAGSIAEIANAHDDAYEQITDVLEVELNGPVGMYLYPSAEALYHSTARDSGFAITAYGEVHSIWTSPDDHQSLGHEMTHVITAQTIGEPREALLGEGLAVCLDQSGRDYRAVGQDLVQQERWLTLDQLSGDAWFDQEAETAYHQSGSVVCYLLEQYGAESLRSLYTQELQTGLEQVLGISRDQLQEDWLAWAREY